MAHEEFETLAALSGAGAATAEEEASLQRHILECEDCLRLADEYAAAATLIASSLEPVEPPAELRAEIMASREDQGGPMSKNTWWLATAATLFLALWGWREIGMRVMREHLHSQQAEIQQLTEQRRTLTAQHEKLASAMAALASGGTKAIELTGQQPAPQASARVFLEPDKRSAIVFFSSLPENPSDKSYQLWILRADKPEPESVGVFDVTRGTAAITIENLPLATEIKGLALTLEKRGGAPQPTSNTFYVAGSV